MRWGWQRWFLSLSRFLCGVVVIVELFNCPIRLAVLSIPTMLVALTRVTFPQEIVESRCVGPSESNSCSSFNIQLKKTILLKSLFGNTASKVKSIRRTNDYCTSISLIINDFINCWYTQIRFSTVCRLGHTTSNFLGTRQSPILRILEVGGYSIGNFMA